MTNFKGVIIEESLENKGCPQKVKILSTKVESGEKEHETPWLSQWDLAHGGNFMIKRQKAMAEEISKSLEHKHGGSWYADFKK